MNPKQIVYAFLANQLDFKRFKQFCESDAEVLDWIQSIIPSDFKGMKLVEDTEITKKIEEIKAGPKCDPLVLLDLLNKRYHRVEVPYDFKRVYSRLQTGSEISQWFNFHSELARIMKKAFPSDDIEISDYISKLYDFITTACPNYIGGPEVDSSNILLGIYSSLNTESQKSKKKEFRLRIKALFLCKGTAYPRWIQEPEWPMGVSSPMRFISQSHEGDLFKYVFEDVDTGELRTIIQLA